MKTISAPTVKALEKQVNDFLFTNTAYIPKFIQRTSATRKKPKDKPASKLDQEKTTKDQNSEADSSLFVCMLKVSPISRAKTLTIYHGALSKLPDSTLGQINPHSILEEGIVTDDDKVIAFVVQ